MSAQDEREFIALMASDEGATGYELADNWKVRAARPVADTAIGFRTLHRLKVDAGCVIDLLKVELDDAQAGMAKMARASERIQSHNKNLAESMMRATRYGNELIERNRHLEGELEVLTVQSNELGADLDATKTRLFEAMKDVERWKAAHTEVHDAWRRVCADLAEAKKGAVPLDTSEPSASVDPVEHTKTELIEAYEGLHDRQASDAWADFAQSVMDDGAPPVPPCPDEVPTCPETGVEHDPEFERDLDERIVAVWYTGSSRGNATRPTLRTLGELGDPLEEMYGALFERGEPYHLIRGETRGASAWLYREGFAPDTVLKDCIGCGRQLMTVRDRQGDELALDYKGGIGWRPHTCGWLKDTQ